MALLYFLKSESISKLIFLLPVHSQQLICLETELLLVTDTDFITTMLLDQGQCELSR